MKISTYKRLDRSDIHVSKDKQKDTEWFVNIMGLINTPIETAINALNNRITFKDNIMAEVQTIAIAHNTPTVVYQQSLKSAASFLIVGYASGETITASSIIGYKSTTEPIINVQFESGNTNKVSVAIVLFSQ